MRLGSIAFGVAFLLSALPVDAQVLTGEHHRHRDG